MKDEEPAPTLEEIMRCHRERMAELDRKLREFRDELLRQKAAEEIEYAAAAAQRKQRAEDLWAYAKSVVEQWDRDDQKNEPR
ncbi:MAG TPA: hypothetical protein VGR02_15255 [Thermoanaerobaculia bacterium]|jgi:hypothetical protein|nr:hypothetical protein [Thermoanaerobaculia bacterium]